MFYEHVNSFKTMERLRHFSFIEKEIAAQIKEIREVFEDHFDRTWFSILIDDLPIDSKTIREIRGLVSLNRIYPEDIPLIYSGVKELESFTVHVRRYLVPFIKDRLLVSGFYPKDLLKDKNQYILRRLVAYTFPFNLDRLSFLTSGLKATILSFYPYLKD